MKQVQKISWIAIIIYIVFAFLGATCILAPIFSIMPKFFGICVLISGACTLLGMFFNRKTIYDTVKYTVEIQEESDLKPEQEPETEPVVEDKPKKAPKKKKGGK